LQALARRAKRAAELTPDRGCRLFGRKNPPEKRCKWPPTSGEAALRPRDTPARVLRKSLERLVQAASLHALRGRGRVGVLRLILNACAEFSLPASALSTDSLG
jgi:hypothetical protein